MITMVVIGTDARFEAAHRQLNDTGKCGFLHGHNWKVEFKINAPISSLNECGYIIDYKKLKDLVNTFDHKVLLNREDPLAEVLFNNRQRVHAFPCEPTCENIANILLETVEKIFEDENITYNDITITVWENGDSWATVNSNDWK